MSRTVREQWGELHKFMSRVKAKYPTSQCFLKQEKLYVDNRFLVRLCKSYIELKLKDVRLEPGGGPRDRADGGDHPRHSR